MMWGMRIFECVFAVSWCYLVLFAAARVTDPTEVHALLAVKSSLDDPMQHLRNWNKGDPCRSNWTGVLCPGTVGTDGHFHVQEIQLLNMNLSGLLAPELGQFSQLLVLDFMWNNLTGSIPKEIGNISTLKLLLLNGNKFTGSLPDELGNLSNLNRLQVDQNEISGQVPKSFANLSRVKHLHLNNNSISGQLPPELSKISSLLHLLLDNNNLYGFLPPEFSNLQNLRILQLDNNNFSGSEIPHSYSNFSKLVKLSLRNCSLQGSIPDLSRIVNLTFLDLSQNHLSGTIPSNKLSERMTTIDLSDNQLDGPIPRSFSDLPQLETLSLDNNHLNGSVPPNIWQNISFNGSTRLLIDLRNNSLSNITGVLNPPPNVTLRLGGNPICNNSNLPNRGVFCALESGEGMPMNSTNSTVDCPKQSCPIADSYEYVPASPLPCFCAAPLRIGYRLKSPSFTYFPPYIYQFDLYLTSYLNMDPYQMSIESYIHEQGRIRMYLKLYPRVSDPSKRFNDSEVLRIRGLFTTWTFPPNDFFGPYELLNFTLLGPYSNLLFGNEGLRISKGIWAAIILGAIASAVATTTILTILIARHHARHQRVLSRNRQSSRASMKIDGVKTFTFKEVALATENFNSSSKVGQGGYGKVYKGTLPDRTIVAIKRAEEGSLQGQKEFLNEIKLLSRLHHRNLVSLVGYCDDEAEQMLVYEFMPNGTLRDWLSGKAKENLTFSMRLCIALGAAKGILYLHTEANPPVFHRDIKASNILLDSKLNAKVADFGLSRLAPALEEEGTVPHHVSTIVRGTPGYVDPEYLLTHKLTDKSDVYSLGVVFLELLTGMHAISHGKNIVREVKMACQSGLMLSIIDSKMGAYPSDCIEIFGSLALCCCNDKPEKRPSMIDVVRELERILKMLPETGTVSSEFTYMHSSKSLSSSSSYSHQGQTGSSWNVLGSDVMSDATLAVSPR
ncbi:hypothetical protein SLE2022_341740 [Rubroshorea leprosula]